MFKKIFSLSMILILTIGSGFGISSSAAAPLPAPDAVMRSDALVLVNSLSTAFADFQHFIQPYLDHFGVPYTVLDITTAPVPADIGQYAVILTGHRQLDVTDAYLDAAEEGLISAAVNAGTGLVNFDNDLSVGGTTPRYQFIQDIFNFGYLSPPTGSGVTFTAPGWTGTQINLWEDDHQDPDLITTTDSAALIANDNLWTEFLWTSRGYPGIFGSYDEVLPTLHFFGAVPDGEYTLVAHLYWSHNLRYYWGYTAADPKAYSFDVTSGNAGNFSDYTLGTVTVTGGQFDLYVQDADPLTGGVDYTFFGWSSVRLVPVGAPPPVMHYITQLHTAGETISTGGMTLAGITLPTGVESLASTGTQPFLAVKESGLGRAVQFGAYNWMSHSVKGPIFGLDDLVWRSIVWAARKPFVMQGLPPFLTMRVDDESGPFNWIHIANEFGFKPWAGLFFHNVDDIEAADLSTLVNAGQATTSIHAFNGGFFYYNHSGADWPDPTMAAYYAEGTAWHQSHNIPIARWVLPHYYEFGTNAFQGLHDWGVDLVGTMMNPGNGYGAPWIMNGPFRKYETGSSSAGSPVYYADFMTIPNHPEFDGEFFNCVTEIRDDAGYEWYPSNDVPGTIGRGTRQSKRALDSMALATLFTHGYYTAGITEANWRAILQGITDNLVSYNPIFVTMDYACQYVRAMHTSNITASLYDTDTRTVTTSLGGKTDMPTQFFLFTQEGPDIRQVMVDVPTFDGSAQVPYTLAGPLDHIALSPASATVATGGLQQFTALGYDASNNPIPNLPFTWSVVNGGGTISASGLFTAGSTPGSFANTVAATFGGITGYASVEVVAPSLHHFTFAAIPSPQYVGAPFQVTITARDISGNLLNGYTGQAALSASAGTIIPTQTGSFVAGSWSGDVTLSQVAHDVTLTAQDGAVSGVSGAFEVQAAPAYYAVTSPSYLQTAGAPFDVTVTAFRTQIDLWEDAHQDPDLVTTQDVPTLVNNSANAIWTEFYYPASRPYPSIMASALHTTGLATMHFSAGGIPNGRYKVIANLYDNAAMRYFFGFTAADPQALSIDTLGGLATGVQHREYTLGEVDITGNTFNLYTNKASLITTGYDIFGWAWIRLENVSPAQTTINLSEDNHQEPDLVTTSDVPTLVNNSANAIWTEFYYPASRPYPSILASALHTTGLATMRFHTEGLPNGRYEVIANLYDNAAMRYFFGYASADPRALSIVVPGGATGTQHREYSLGFVEITDNTFNLYTNYAELVAGGYEMFGWAHIRLVPQNNLTMSSSSASMLFDGDGDGTFGEPGDALKPLVNGTLTIPALDATAATGVIITTTDMLGQSGSNTYTIQHAAASNLEISPTEATVTAGENQLYSAAASDAFGNIWDATGETVFSIEAGAGGSWLDNQYTSLNPGDWIVNGAYSGLNDTALLHVQGVVEPTCVTVQRGLFGTVADTYIWQSLTTSAFGASGRLYTGVRVHSSRGPGETRSLLRFDLDFLPAGVSITSAALKLWQIDAGSGQSVGLYRVTSPWSESQPTWNAFASAFDSSAAWGSFTASGSGWKTIDLQALVAAWAGGVHPNNGLMLINTGAGGLDQFYSGEWSVNHPSLEVCYLQITHGPAVAIEVTPANQTVAAGESLAYTATARDSGGATWDVTASTSFSIEAGAGGSWLNNTYTSQNPGTWVVTGQYAALSDTASLTVEAHGPAVSLSVSPADATITAGESQAYQVTAHDALNNTWDVTSLASFSISAGAGGSWLNNIYTSASAGDWTVTASYSGLQGTAALHVLHAAAVNLELTPAEATVVAGGAVAYQAAARDAFGNTWDVTPTTGFSIEAGAGGSWAANVYTSEITGDWQVTGLFAALSDTALLHVTGGAPTCVTVQRGLFGTVLDTYIWESLPTSQYGLSSRMYTGAKDHSKRGPGETRALVQFDLGFLPAGAAIQSATLELYQVDTGSAGMIHLYRVTSPWTESQPTWNTFASAYDPAVWASFQASGAGWKSIELTTLVTAWASGAHANNGLMLANAIAGGLDQFYTSEWTVDNHPSLEVCYIAP